MQGEKRLQQTVTPKTPLFDTPSSCSAFLKKNRSFGQINQQKQMLVRQGKVEGICIEDNYDYFETSSDRLKTENSRFISKEVANFTC